MKDFDTFAKIAYNLRGGDLGKLIITTGFEKLPKLQKNRPIWSHCRFFIE